MILIIKRRGGGKTTQLLKFMEKNPDTVFACFSEYEAYRLRKAAEHLSPDRFVTAYDIVHGHKRVPPDKRLLVDNADYILQSLFKHDIFMATVTGADG